MKKILLLVAFIVTVTTQSLLAQDVKPTPLAPLLTWYYNIKDAFIKSSSADAAAYAGDFLKAVNAVDAKSLPAADKETFLSLQEKLAFDARHISESTDIAHQREHFANFFTNFYKLVKGAKITGQVIYYDYCPMKKSYWLSAGEAIKNPYYGSQMLTCGKVTETLNK